MSGLVCGYLNLADLDPAATVRAAAAGGFRAVGLRITGHRPGDADAGLVGRPAALTALRRVLDGEGVALANIATYRFVPGTDPRDYRPVLEAAATLGAPMMVANCFTPDHALATANLAAVCESAAGFGMKVGLEFMPVSTVPRLADAVAIMQGTGSSAAGLIVDALHLVRSGGTPADLAGIDPGLLLAFQLCDAPLAPPADLHGEMRAGRLYPGEGELPLAAMLAALPAAGLELEAEVPHARVAGLPGAERARRAFEATTAFLAAHGSG